RLNELFVEERKKSVLDVSLIPSSITAHGPGYIDRENEVIVGLQTEAPLKRAIMPNGGLRMVKASTTAELGSYPYALNALSTIRRPPFGMIARLRGASVWSPTITSFSRSMYPGACAVIELGICETSST